MNEADCASVFKAETTKSIGEFLEAFERNGAERGFLINNRATMDMARTFESHGFAVNEGFDVHLVQVCNPAKASKALSANPERAPLIPKFIALFTAGGRTQVRLLRIEPALAAALVEDEAFPQSLKGSFDTLAGLIEASL